MNAKDELCRDFGRTCMLTGLRDEITYHHIDKAADGGPRTYENGALLSNIAQRWLHCSIEQNDPRLYSLINDCLQLYKCAFQQENWDLVLQWEDEILPLVWRDIIQDVRGKDKNNKEVKKLIRRRELNGRENT